MIVTFFTIVWILILARIAVIDQLTMEIPDIWNLLLGIVGLLSVPFMGNPDIGSRLVGMMVVSLPMVVMDLFFPAAFGGGDVKLMAAAGLFLGWRSCLVAAVFAFFAAGLYSVFLLLTKRAGREDVFAFGPFLCAGLVLAVVLGDSLVVFFV